MIKETFKNEETGGVKVAAIAAGSGQLIANIILSIATQQMGGNCIYVCMHSDFVCFVLYDYRTP